MFAQDVLLARMFRVLLFASSPFSVSLPPLDILQLFVNKGPFPISQPQVALCVSALGDVLALILAGLVCYLSGRKVLWVSLSFVVANALVLAT